MTDPQLLGQIRLMTRAIEQNTMAIQQLTEKLAAKKPAEKKSRANPDCPCPYFDAWWGHYPKKVGKKPALRAWNALKYNPEQKEIVVKDMMVRAKAWKDSDTDMRFIPHPTTFLNQCRWKDDLAHAIPAKQEKLSDLNDNELMAKAKEAGISTHGLTRFQLIDRLQTR